MGNEAKREINKKKKKELQEMNRYKNTELNTGQIWNIAFLHQKLHMYQYYIIISVPSTEYKQMNVYIYFLEIDKTQQEAESQEDMLPKIIP